MSFWLPSIIEAAAVKDTMQTGLYSAIPYATAAITMIVIGRSSDRRGKRRYHNAIPALVGSLAPIRRSQPCGANRNGMVSGGKLAAACRKQSHSGQGSARERVTLIP